MNCDVCNLVIGVLSYVCLICLLPDVNIEDEICNIKDL